MGRERRLVGAGADREGWLLDVPTEKVALWMCRQRRLVGGCADRKGWLEDVPTEKAGLWMCRQRRLLGGCADREGWLADVQTEKVGWWMKKGRLNAQEMFREVSGDVHEFKDYTAFGVINRNAREATRSPKNRLLISEISWLEIWRGTLADHSFKWGYILYMFR